MRGCWWCWYRRFGWWSDGCWYGLDFSADTHHVYFVENVRGDSISTLTAQKTSSIWCCSIMIRSWTTHYMVIQIGSYWKSYTRGILGFRCLQHRGSVSQKSHIHSDNPSALRSQLQLSITISTNTTIMFANSYRNFLRIHGTPIRDTRSTNIKYRVGRGVNIPEVIRRQNWHAKIYLTVYNDFYWLAYFAWLYGSNGHKSRIYLIDDISSSGNRI